MHLPEDLRAEILAAAREGAEAALREAVTRGDLATLTGRPPAPRDTPDEAADEPDAGTGLLCVPGVAKKLSVSTRTVERLVAAGELHPIRVGGQRRFHPDTVDAYLRHAAKARTRRTRGRTPRRTSTKEARR